MPVTHDGLDAQLGLHEVDVLLERAVRSRTITASAPHILAALAVVDTTDPARALDTGRSEAAVAKTRQRSVARLRTCRWALALRAA